MSVQNYPWVISVYKGENRILIIPAIEHIGGYSILSSWCINIEKEDDCIKIGMGILDAMKYIKNSPISNLTSKEQDADVAWKRNSKYKSWISFWKNNYNAKVIIHENGELDIYSTLKTEGRKGGYSGSIKKIVLPNADKPEEIGRAVIEVLEAAEEYYKEKAPDDPYPSKKLQLLNDSALTIKHPADKHFEDAEDGGAAEIYQCYSYVAQEGGESSAEFFIGIAPELDCSIEPENVRSVWEEMHGKAECLEMKMCEHEVFKYRAEMINKNMHKISYLVQQQEDLLLECSMELHQPGRRKKLDEKLTTLFEEFVRNCKNKV